MVGRGNVLPAVLILVVAAGAVGGGAYFAMRGRAAADGGGTSTGTGAQPGTTGDPVATATAIAATLSDEDLIGQVVMPYAYGSDANKVTSASQAANRKYAGVATPAEMIAKYHLGGLILMGWSADDPTAGNNKTSNVDSPKQIRGLTDGLQQAAGKLKAGVPLLIGTDQEYGTVTRVKDPSVVQLPSAMGLGAANRASVTERAWQAAGADLAAMGFNVDFAPDADVLGETPGGVIGSRSFGSDPKAVADQVAAAVKGLQSAGVAASLKHFPGHGHTTTNSHTALPALGQSRGSLESGDLPPFAAGIASGTDMIMSGHLDVQSIDPGMPASFSAKVLTDLLRGQMGFTGVVVTDALNMDPAKRWSPGDAAVRALNAGNDLLLMPPDLSAAYQGLVDGLHSGSLQRPRLVEAATRVLTLKVRRAAVRRPGFDTLGNTERRAAADDAAAAAVTVLRGSCSGAVGNTPVTVTAANGREQQRDWLKAALAKAGATVVDSGGSRVHLVGYSDEKGDLAADAAVTVAMDTPYLLREASSPTLVATFASTQSSMGALAAVLAGKAKAGGRSPVAVDGLGRSACGG